MTRFAFVIHPLRPRDAALRFPWMRYVPEGWIEPVLGMVRPTIASRITGVRSITGAETEGWFIGCPLTPNLMVRGLRLEQVYESILQCTEIAADLGADLVGLGAFTSVVGDGGITIAERAPLPVTTGNSYTVATAIEGTVRACEQVGIVPGESVLAVVGATGSIGRTCAKMLAPQFGRTLLIGRNLERTKALADEIPGTELASGVDALRDADAIVTVTSSDAAVIEPEHLRPGAVVCGGARPRAVSTRVAKLRPDVLVIEGGIVRVPGEVDFGLNFGFPPRTAYACMSETMMLALDGRPESFTLGKDVTVEQVRETQRLASKHGFILDRFRSFEREVSEAAIERVRQARVGRVAA